MGMKLEEDDEIISMNLDSDGKYLLIASEKGYGKLTEITEFDTHHRGGKGVKCYKITEKTGFVAGVKAVELEEELLMITNEGIMIRIKVCEISIIGRNTSGVKLINLKEKASLVSMAKVDPEPEEVSSEGETIEDDKSSNEEIPNDAPTNN